MANKKNEEKQKIQYIYPESYEFYEKKIEIEDGIIKLRKGAIANQLDELDIYFKLYFLYQARKDSMENNWIRINWLDVRNQNKSYFKNYLAQPGLREITGYNSPEWFWDKENRLLGDTEVCIVLAGKYLLDTEEKALKFTDFLWSIMRKLIDALNSQGDFPLTGSERKAFVNALLDWEDFRMRNWVYKSPKEQLSLNETEKKELREEILNRTKKFLNQEKQMNDVYDRISTRMKIAKKLKRLEKYASCDLKKEENKIKIEKLEKKWSELEVYIDEDEKYIFREEKRKSDKANEMFWEEWEEYEERQKIAEEEKIPMSRETFGRADVKEGQIDENRRQALREEEQKWFHGEKQEWFINLKNGEDKEQITETDKYTRGIYSALEKDNELDEIVPEVDSILFPAYLSAFFRILVGCYDCFPLLSKQTVYGRKAVKYIGWDNMDRKEYAEFFYLSRYLDYKQEIDSLTKQNDFLEKYYKFYDKSLREIKYTNVMKQRPYQYTNDVCRKKGIKRYTVIYLMEQIFALALFRYETELIVKKRKEVGINNIFELEEQDLYYLKQCLKKIYKLHGVFSRMKVAEEIITYFFEHLKMDTGEWVTYRKRLDDYKKRMKLFERYKINEIFEKYNSVEKEGIDFKSLEKKIECEMEKEHNNILDFYNDRIEWDANDADKNWISRVIPFGQEERKLQEWIITICISSEWKGKL